MKRAAFLITALLVAPLLHADEPKEVPADVKALLEKDIELCNAGEWAADAKLHRLPVLVFDELFREEQAFMDKVRGQNEGLSCKIISCELLEQKTIKPRLSETARGFLQEKDLLIRVKIEAAFGDQKFTNQNIVVIRQTDGKPRLAGYLLDPDADAAN